MGDVRRRGPYKTKSKSKPKPTEPGTTKHPSVSEDKELIDYGWREVIQNGTERVWGRDTWVEQVVYYRVLKVVIVNVLKAYCGMETGMRM